MEWLRQLRFRLSRLLNLRSADEDLVEEIRSHIDIETQENIERGMSPEEARRAAGVKFGSVVVAREESREVWGFRSLETLWQDLRYGARMLVKSPGFTAVAVLFLGLGIGVNTAVFSFVSGVLMPAFPIHEPNRTVRLWFSSPSRNVFLSPVSGADYADLRAAATSFVDLAAYTTRRVNLSGSDEPHSVSAVRATTNFFRLLGVEPAQGRTFLSEEATPGRDRVAVVSGDAWKSYFGADPCIIGKTVSIDGQPYTVVGVMPETFWFSAGDVALWMPLPEPGPIGDRERRILSVVARLRSSVAREEAQVEMKALSARMAQQHPKTNRDWEVRVTGLLALGPGEEVFFVLVSAMVVLLLAAACANITNLLLARGLERRGEVAVRMALGAGRRRIIRQLLAESVLLSLAGGVCSLALAYLAIDFLRSFFAGRVPALAALSLDAKTLAFALGLALTSSLLFGLVPALGASRCQLSEALKEGGRLSPDRRGRRLRGALVVGEIAIATVLLIVTGLLVRSAREAQSLDLGFRPEHLLTLRIEAPEYKYPKASQAARVLREIRDSVASLPGVEAVGAGPRLPVRMGRSLPTTRIAIAGRPEQADAEGDWAVEVTVTPGHFQALGIPLLRGRSFEAGDTESTLPVAVVSRAMAERYWPGESPIGHRVKLGAPDSSEAWRAIVGVVSDVRNDDPGSPPSPHLYLPLSQRPVRAMTFFVRTADDPAGRTDEVRSVVWKIDKDQPVRDVRTMQRVIDDDFAAAGLGLGMVSVFGAIAVVLAMLGVYGVLAHSVGQRTGEIGLRMALGAERAALVRMVVGQGLRWAASGVGAGAVLGALAGRGMKAALFGVSPTDPTTFASVAGFLFFVVILACCLPARRATKVDPMVALRHE